MKTISFVGNSEPPDKLLEIFSKQTPGRSGMWGNLKGVPTYDSDYYGIIDYLPENLKNQVDETKCVFLGAHPPKNHYYSNMRNFKGIKMYDCAHTFGFGEWWLKYDYDYLSKLKPNVKTKNLACILTDANSQVYHRMRREYMDRFCTFHGREVDLYGRIKPWSSLNDSYKGPCGSANPTAENGNDHMTGKEPVYENYKYAIEFDAFGKYYFSERVFDCLLLWCYPIYCGGENLHKFIPAKSFSYFDINGNCEDIIKIINLDVYKKALPHMKMARKILLNKLQLWPRIHKAIFGTHK